MTQIMTPLLQELQCASVSLSLWRAGFWWDQLHGDIEALPAVIFHWLQVTTGQSDNKSIHKIHQKTKSTVSTATFFWNHAIFLFLLELSHPLAIPTFSSLLSLQASVGWLQPFNKPHMFIYLHILSQYLKISTMAIYGHGHPSQPGASLMPKNWCPEKAEKWVGCGAKRREPNADLSLCKTFCSSAEQWTPPSLRCFGLGDDRNLRCGATSRSHRRNHILRGFILKPWSWSKEKWSHLFIRATLPSKNAPSEASSVSKMSSSWMSAFSAPILYLPQLSGNSCMDRSIRSSVARMERAGHNSQWPKVSAQHLDIARLWASGIQRPAVDPQLHHQQQPAPLHWVQPNQGRFVPSDLFQIGYLNRKLPLAS